MRRGWRLESHGDARTSVGPNQGGWPTREALVRYVRDNLGLRVGNDGTVYPPRGREPIGAVVREGDE